jgi:hypothetical protein
MLQCGHGGELRGKFKHDAVSIKSPFTSFNAATEGNSVESQPAPGCRVMANGKYLWIRFNAATEGNSVESDC